MPPLSDHQHPPSFREARHALAVCQPAPRSTTLFLHLDPVCDVLLSSVAAARLTLLLPESGASAYDSIQEKKLRYAQTMYNANLRSRGACICCWPCCCLSLQYMQVFRRREACEVK
jgi:hypothetical protein